VMTAICNCRSCQRQTGSAFSIIVAVPKGALEFEGKAPKVYRDTGESGLPVLRAFCADCGSPIFSDVAATPDLDWIKAGTLDDTSWLRPQINVWCESAQPWVRLSDEIPQVPKNPPG
jgi:hypothetical protein